MDASSFDNFAGSLSTRGSRRRALVATLGGALGFLGPASPEEATAGGKCKPACNECAACKKGKCRKTPNGKQCKKGKCKPKPAGTACSVGTCQSGSCVATAPTIPTPPPFCQGKADFIDCGDGKQCSGGVCATPPTCKPHRDETDVNCSGCCSASCSEREVGEPVMICRESTKGEPCYYDYDCFSDTCRGDDCCVGFVCR